MSWKHKPWISKQIQQKIKLRNKTYSKFIATKHPFWLDRYKLINKDVRKSLFVSKKEFCKKYFEKNLNNLRKIWSGINDIILNKRHNVAEEIFLNDINGINSDQKKVAATFNKYFTNVAHELVSKLGNPNTKYQDYLKNPNEHSMFLNEVEPGEVRKILLSLDVSKSGDICGITPFLMKSGCEQLYETLTYLYNRTFHEGIFPKVLKFANVIPIHKSDSKFITSNYRPISLLTILGKCLEKLMYTRMYKYITANGILCKNQYGFQKGKSTADAILDVQSKIVHSLEQGENPCCTFLDLAKAFDTVNKDILLYKLNYYGIRGNVLKWFNSYLSDRTQCVQVNNYRSNCLPVTVGVPQGSILGPLLFLLYINDIVLSSNILKFITFADDTCLFISHKSKLILNELLNEELLKVNDWLIANKLSLNIKKTKTLLYRHKNGNNKTFMEASINGTNIEEVTCFKYLGVYLDNKLTFKEHTDHVIDKLKKGNRLLARIRHFIDPKGLKSFYNAHIQSHISYCSVIWGSAASSYVEKIFKLQKKSIKLLSFGDRDNVTSFKTTKILPVQSIIDLSRVEYIWKITNGKTLFDLGSHGVSQSVNFIDTKKFIQPYCRSEAARNFVLCAGIRVWNKSSFEIRNSSNISVLKKNAKSFFLNFY